MNVEQLMKDVVWLKDIEEIKQLQYKYMYLLGTFTNGDKIADLFTDDGRLEVQDSGILRGRKEIVWFFDKGDAAGYQGLVENYQYSIKQGNYEIMWPGECLATNPIIEINGSTAKGKWFMFGFYTLPYPKGPQAIWNAGKYEMEYRKENEVWKINYLHFLPNFECTYEEGWAKQPMICSYNDIKKMMKK